MDIQNVTENISKSIQHFLKPDYDNSYREKCEYQTRKKESTRVRGNYPNRIPIIMVPHKSIALDKNKYLVPSDLTIGQFYHVIRKRITISPHEGIFFFTEDNTLPPASEVLSSFYNKHKNKDGFLYLYLNSENTFG